MVLGIPLFKKPLIIFVLKYVEVPDVWGAALFHGRFFSPFGGHRRFGKDGFELPELPRSKLRGSGEKDQGPTKIYMLEDVGSKSMSLGLKYGLHSSYQQK